MSSFGYLTDGNGGGMHYQNQHDIVPYTSAATGGDQPMYRALPIDQEEAMIREWVLQLKLAGSAVYRSSRNLVSILLRNGPTY